MNHLQEKKNLLTREDGFTLVEIIAVLVILGILAAVAIPKYFDLQEEAKTKALEAALGEGIGRVNQHFAKRLLSGDTTGAIIYNDSNIGSDLGDFTLSTTQAGNSITLTVTGTTGALNGQSMVRTIPRPGSP